MLAADGWKAFRLVEELAWSETSASSFCVVFHLLMLVATLREVAIGGTLYSLPGRSESHHTKVRVQSGDFRTRGKMRTFHRKTRLCTLICLLV